MKLNNQTDSSLMMHAPCIFNRFLPSQQRLSNHFQKILIFERKRYAIEIIDNFY